MSATLRFPTITYPRLGDTSAWLPAPMLDFDTTTPEEEGEVRAVDCPTPSLGALLRAKLDEYAFKAAPFELHPSLARLDGVNFSEEVVVRRVEEIAGGVCVHTTDGARRKCLWSTVAKSRGMASAAKAEAFFKTYDLEGQTMRCVACATRDRRGVRRTWSAGEWFVAVVMS